MSSEHIIRFYIKPKILIRVYCLLCMKERVRKREIKYTIKEDQIE
jgi:hypothetical protein